MFLLNGLIGYLKLIISPQTFEGQKTFTPFDCLIMLYALLLYNLSVNRCGFVDEFSFTLNKYISRICLIVT